MRTTILTSTFLALLVLSPVTLAQNFNHTQGYIFEQGYVTRIKEASAAEKLQIKDAGEWLLQQHYAHGKNETLANGVSRSGKTLVLRTEGKPALRLQTYIYRGKDDRGDSQRFVYIRSLEKYHLVCVEFDHDAPGFLLIEKDSLKIYFVDH